MSTTAIVEVPVLTMKEKWQAALREVRREGIKVRQNVRQCCRGCITPEKLGLTPDAHQPYVYTYGGQGGAYSWYNDEVVYTDSLRATARSGWRPRRKTVDKIYFNHGGAGTTAATILVDALTRHGFDVEWDGSEHSCVIVNF